MNDDNFKKVPDDLMAVLGCPNCNGPLAQKTVEAGLFLECPACGIEFPVEQDIPDLLPQSGRPVSK